MKHSKADPDKQDKIQKIKITPKKLKEALQFFRYVHPYRYKFAAGLLFILLSSLATMMFPFLLKKLIDSAYEVKMGHTGQAPGNITLWMLGILVLRLIFSFLQLYLFSWVGEHALADVRKELYGHIIKMPMHFFAQKRVGELTSRVSNDVGEIQNAVSYGLAEILKGFCTLLIGIGLIFYISPRLTCMMLLILPVFVVVAVQFGKRIRLFSRKAQDHLADAAIVLQETLQGISVVKSFSNEFFEITRYKTSIKKVVTQAIRTGQARSLFVSVLLFCMFTGIVLIVWYGSGLIQRGLLSFGDLTAFVMYTAFVGGSMSGFADLYSQLQRTLGATQRVWELMRETTEEVEVEGEPLQNEYKLHGHVKLQHVSFSYPQRKETTVLNDINLEVLPGEQIAIIGASGAGKSTLISLILRFYDPDSGNILFDGKPAYTIPLSQLRRQMALVSQDIILFGGTIAENIAYGKLNATQQEIEKAAHSANAHSFIMGFPEGYQTVVGERGIKLSGGQRQRIAIARAILRDPVILILDEATNSLDAASETLVQDALLNLMKGRTTFVIAHRLSTICHADKIIVLEKGVIREKGTHYELLKYEHGLYRKFSNLQVAWGEKLKDILDK